MTPYGVGRIRNRATSWLATPFPLFAVTFVVALFTVSVALWLKCSDFPHGQLRWDTPAGEIWGPTEIGQGFVARYSGLHRIDLLMATYARHNSHDVTFHLVEGSREELFQTFFNAAEVQDNGFFSFDFPALDSSRGKVFLFYLTSPDSVPTSESSSGDAITVWSTIVDSYPEGAKYVNGDFTEGDLTFITFYRGHPFEVLRRIVQGLAERKPSIGGNAYLAPTLILLYWTSFCLFGLLVTHMTECEKVEESKVTDS